MRRGGLPGASEGRLLRRSRPACAALGLAVGRSLALSLSGTILSRGPRTDRPLLRPVFPTLRSTVLGTWHLSLPRWSLLGPILSVSRSAVGRALSLPCRPLLGAVFAALGTRVIGSFALALRGTSLPCRSLLGPVFAPLRTTVRGTLVLALAGPTRLRGSLGFLARPGIGGGASGSLVPDLPGDAVAPVGVSGSRHVHPGGDLLEHLDFAVRQGSALTDADALQADRADGDPGQ